MFKIELGNVNFLKSSFSAISDIVDEISIVVDSEGLKSTAMDRSHVTFVNLNLNKDLFTNFVCDSVERVDLDTGELMKVLKRSKSSDFVVLELDGANLVVKFIGDATRTFKIRLIELEGDVVTPPSIDFPCEFSVPFKLFKDSVSDIELFSDVIGFNVDKDFVNISAEGNLADVNINYVHGSKVDGDFCSVFTLGNIKSMLKADKFSSDVLLGVGDNLPLSLVLCSDDGLGELGFLLAPRIDEGDD